ncbi:hypothetical protein J6A31_07500 [bacterium]|nr:hypothetical protein [bacterium]
MRIRRIFAASMAVITVLTMAGCASNETKTSSSADKETVKVDLKTADEVIAKNEEAMKDVKNFSLNGGIDVDINMTTTDGSVNVAIPATLDYTLKASDTKEMYVDVKIDVDLPDSMEMEDIDAGASAYLKVNEDNVETWAKTSDTDVWSYSKISESDLPSDTDSELTMPEIDFSKYETMTIPGDLSTSDVEYIITYTFKSVFDSEAYASLTSDMNASFTSGMEASGAGSDIDMNTMFESIGIDLANIQEQLGKGKMSMTFDKDTLYMTGFDITDVAYETTIEENDMVLSINLSSENDVTDYNKLTVSDYTPSDDIKNNAVDSSVDEIYATGTDDPFFN